MGIAPPGPYYELAETLGKAETADGESRFTPEQIEKKSSPSAAMEDAQSVIVCLFPYYTECDEESNVSIHARGKDYHRVIRSRLRSIGDELKQVLPGFRYMEFSDTGPLDDRYLAYRAGLGFYGINSCIINPKYGSYVFIGYIICNYPFRPDKPLDSKCMGCLECVRSCPGGAVSKDAQGIFMKYCASYISQKKGTLSQQEIDILKGSGMVYGCDICQKVCPHNRKPAVTPIREFKENLIINLDEEQLKLSKRQFLKEYGDRAFAWKGNKVLKRNLEVIK